MEKQQVQIECDSCNKTFLSGEIQIYPRIVRKEKMTAVAYCFKCPECGQEYICYFKDSQVNALFKAGKFDDARIRMAYLKEIFTNGSTV